MKILRLVVLFCALLVTACQKGDCPVDYHAEKNKMANEVWRKVAEQLKQDLGLCPIGTMGQMMNEIQKLGLDFYYYQPVDLQKSRKILAHSVNTMLQEINQKEEIRPYLSRYPFRPWNAEISIILQTPEGREVEKGNLWSISASDGKFTYMMKLEGRKLPTTVYEETYEEALERLADPSLPLVPFQPKTHINPELWARLKKSIRLVNGDGIVWQLDEKGSWVKEGEALEKAEEPSSPLAPVPLKPGLGAEEWSRLREGISLVDGDGIIWQLDEKGSWVRR